MRKISVFAMEKSAQAWCGEKTKNKEMDVDLCMEFAKIYDEMWCKPLLGNATTRELFQELKARLGDDIISWIDEYKLNYRTVQD